MGGEHHALGETDTLAFQPLRDIHDDTERTWAAEWVASLLAHEKVEVTPEVKEALWSALTSLASAPPEERTLTGLSVLLQSNALKAALLRSEEHTSELQSLMRISYAVFCLKKKSKHNNLS